MLKIYNVLRTPFNILFFCSGIFFIYQIYTTYLYIYNTELTVNNEILEIVIYIILGLFSALMINIEYDD